MPGSNQDDPRRLPPPPASISRRRPTVVSPMSCRSCRGRKSKCSREIPTCETCQRHGFQCIYDATPKKRVSHSHLVKDLLRRMDMLERQSTDSDAESSQDRVPQVVPPEKVPDIPCSTSMRSNPEVGITARREALAAFFSHVHGKPYVFLDEEATRNQVMNDQVSDGFLHALVAVSSWHVAGVEGESKTDQAQHHLSISEKCTNMDEMSLETVQSLTLQALCLISLGHGSTAWMKIGAAIRMAQGIELQKQAFSDRESLPLKIHPAQQCAFTLYAMDRFSVCGSNRPMIISDDWLQESRQSANRFGLGESHNLDQLSLQDLDQGLTIYHLFADIVKLLGQSTQYLQRGGVQGDSHFPWHQHSSLSKLVGRLTEWKNRAEPAISFHTLDYSNSVNVNWLCLSWFSYHAILIRLYRQFLPLIMVERGLDHVPDPWKQETSRKCVEHAIKSAELCDKAKEHGYSWPFFTSFCLASAATVLIHATYYDFAAESVCHLVTVVERLIAMLANNPLVELQLEMLRRMYKRHAEMVADYCSGTLATTDLDLTQFYKRYPKGEFDTSHIPFTQPRNWMDASLDGPDDLFALGSLPERLSGLRGSPYTFEGPAASMSQTPRVQATSERWPSSPGLFEGMSSLNGDFEPDYGYYMPTAIEESQTSQGYETMDEELLKSLLEHMEGDYTGIEF